jgi:hypothetical protein
MGLEFFLYQSYPSKIFYIKTQDQVVSELHLLTRNLALDGKYLKTASIRQRSHTSTASKATSDAPGHERYSIQCLQGSLSIDYSISG